MQVGRSLLLMQNETFGRIFAEVTLDSGKRVSNTWAMYLEEENSFMKVRVILHVL